MVQEKVIKAVSLFVKEDTAEINADSEFADLGLDSLDTIELALNLEEEFGIELKMDASITSVKDLVRKIEGAVKI